MTSPMTLRNVAAMVLAAAAVLAASDSARGDEPPFSFDIWYGVDMGTWLRPGQDDVETDKANCRIAFQQANGTARAKRASDGAGTYYVAPNWTDVRIVGYGPTGTGELLGKAREVLLIKDGASAYEDQFHAQIIRFRQVTVTVQNWGEHRILNSWFGGLKSQTMNVEGFGSVQVNYVKSRKIRQ
jgi:hypothetical protein